jgi:serine/threonine-protein kinase
MDLLERLSTLLKERYEVERELGHGGMAVVFLARDIRYNRQVAIKILRPELAASVGSERFLREIQIAAQLQHPHILPLFDSGEANGLLYYVMPYVEGESLRNRLGREKQLSVDEALGIAKNVADALSYANSRGVIHRDIKPENILLSGDNAVVADFGIAHAFSEAGGESLTESGVAVGTPAYMSPEQAGGEADLDARSDVYALGCVLYEMLSGEPPFTGRTAQAILARHLQERVPSLEVIRPTLPFSVVDLVERALAKVPADRFRTAQQVVEAIRVCETGTVPRRRFRRTRRGMVWAAVAAGFAVVAAAWYLGGLGEATGNPDYIVAFPLTVTGEQSVVSADMGGDVAIYIVGLLDGWGALTWINGSDLVEGPPQGGEGDLSVRGMRSIAREAGAGYFVTGRLMLVGERTTLLLALYDVEQQQPVQRSDTAGPRVAYLDLGLGAVAPLLLSLLPAEQSVDVEAIAGRSAEAVQAFVQGERTYGQGRFREAWEHYDTALAENPQFALAAYKAAKAAVWLDSLGQGRRFVEIAVAHLGNLPPRDQDLARGLHWFIEGDADSALAYLKRARDLDAFRPDVWMAIGQVYRHLIPMEPSQDSLALDALETAHGVSAAFTPPIVDLAKHYARVGRVAQARDLVEELRTKGADTSDLRSIDLMLRCATDLPAAIDWDAEVRAGMDLVFHGSRWFAIGASNPACAIAGWEAVVRDTTAPAEWRFSGAIGLSSLLAGLGRTTELVEFLDTRAPYPQNRWLYITVALAGLDVGDRAELVAASLRGDPWEDQIALRLWFLGLWDASSGRVEELRAIVDALAARLHGEEATRRDSVVHRSLIAHLALAEGDTAKATQLLERLRPSAPRPSLTWSPWESLGYEWLTLARLLEAQGDSAGAARVAAIAEAPGSAANVMFRRPLRALQGR